MPGSWVSRAALLLLATVCLAGQTPQAAVSEGQHPANAAVTIENYSYSPDTITVAVGTSVVWTNRDDVPHNVVSREDLFTSPDLEPKQQFAFTFRRAGTFSYFCTIHPQMTGRVVVK